MGVDRAGLTSVLGVQLPALLGLGSMKLGRAVELSRIDRILRSKSTQPKSVTTCLILYIGRPAHYTTGKNEGKGVKGREELEGRKSQ